MTMDVKDVRSILNDLIQTCKDGQQGFLDATHQVKDLSVKSVFREFSQQRSAFAGELQQAVTRIGGHPETTGTTAGALHRGWIDFKNKITGQSDAAVIKETASGEDSAVKAYEKALEDMLPGDVRALVEQQYTEILKAHARIRSLEVRANGGAV